MRRVEAQKTYEPFIPPHLSFLGGKEQNLPYLQLLTMLMNYIRPEYIKKHFTVKYGTASRELNKAVALPISHNVLSRLLKKHGVHQIDALRECYLIPDEMLQDVLLLQ